MAVDKNTIQSKLEKHTKAYLQSYNAADDNA